MTELAKRDMTQKRLAELSGVSRQTITYIRCGKSCTDEVGQKIADALSVCAHVPVSWVKISPPREMTETQLEQARKNLLNAQTVGHNQGQISTEIP